MRARVRLGTGRRLARCGGIVGPTTAPRAGAGAGRARGVGLPRDRHAAQRDQRGYGRFGALDLSGTLGYGAERLGLLAGGAYKSAQPFESGDGLRFTEIYPAASPNRYRGAGAGLDAYALRTGWAKLTGAPAAGQRGELSIAYQQADDVLYPYLKMDARGDDAARVNGAFETGALGPLSRARAQAYFNRVEHDMDDARRCSSWGRA